MKRSLLLLSLTGFLYFPQAKPHHNTKACVAAALTLVVVAKATIAAIESTPALANLGEAILGRNANGIIAGAVGLLAGQWVHKVVSE